MVGVYNKGLLYIIFFQKGWEGVGMFFTLEVHRVIHHIENYIWTSLIYGGMTFPLFLECDINARHGIR
jgi:hypothetical protein